MGVWERRGKAHELVARQMGAQLVERMRRVWSAPVHESLFIHMAERRRDLISMVYRAAPMQSLPDSGSSRSGLAAGPQQQSWPSTSRQHQVRLRPYLAGQHPHRGKTCLGSLADAYCAEPAGGACRKGWACCGYGRPAGPRPSSRRSPCSPVCRQSTSMPSLRTSSGSALGTSGTHCPGL